MKAGPPTPRPPVPVVAAVVAREGRYLLARRPDHKRHGGLWEFPGGKVNAGESRLEAARRELAEELELVVTHLGRTLHALQDEDSPFVIEFIEVAVDGDPVAREHTAIGWYTKDEAAALALAPADAEFVRRL